MCVHQWAISPASDEHYPGLHQAVDAVARERSYLAITQAPTWEQSVAFYRNLATADFPHFVALQGDEVVGWVDISPQFGDTRAHIGALGIGLVPSARHKGLGTRMMKAAIEKAWSKGLTRIELTVRTDNLNAKALYERMGFEVEGTMKRGILINGKYFDLHLMALLR